MPGLQRCIGCCMWLLAASGICPGDDRPTGERGRRQILRHLPQRPDPYSGPGARSRGGGPSSNRGRALGKSDSQASGQIHAAAWSATARSGYLRRARRDLSRPNRQRGRRPSQSRQAAAPASPQPHGISECRARPSRAGCTAERDGVSLLLPADNANSGFDNLADLLFISPTAMESYLGAAEKISRLAVGDPAFPVMVNMLPHAG